MILVDGQNRMSMLYLLMDISFFLKKANYSKEWGRKAVNLNSANSGARFSGYQERV